MLDPTTRAPTGQLTSRLRERLESRTEILDAYLFGSAARGELQQHSDIDVAVFVEPRAIDRSTYGLDSEIAAFLMSALGSNRVDVVLLNRAPPLLYHRVLRDGIRLVSRDARATTVREGRALSRYCDYVSQLNKIDAIIRRAG